MFNRQDYLNQILALLAQVAHEMAGSAVLQFTDANITAEDFFAGFVSRALGLTLVNVNLFQSNSPGIDLADTGARVAAQVTSDVSLGKIRQTLKTFAGHSLQKQYDRLIFVHPTMERPRRSGQALAECPSGFKFDLLGDVFSFKEIVSECRKLDTDALEDLASWISKEVTIGPRQTRPGANQTVHRIIQLIAFLSEQVPPDDNESPESMPDPDGKLVILSTYRTHLESQFTEHAAAHVSVDAAKAAIGYDGARAARTTSHLRHRSRTLLDQKKNDAREAFEALVRELEDAVRSSGTDYESSAIRYFLACEMIACNVFPLDSLPR
jgi:hypothetical protein